MSKVWRIRSNAYDPENNYSSGRYLELKITETVNEGANTSTLNWELFSKNRSGHYYAVDKTTIIINGTTVYYKDVTRGQSYEFPARIGEGHDYNASGSLTVAHDSNGRKRNVPVVFKTSVWYWNGNPTDWASESGHSFINDVQTNINGAIDLTDIAQYTLSISQGEHSTITVNRTASGVGTLGVLTNGAKLYYGDKLKINFGAENNYEISTHTVNGTPFTSGNTYTVGGNVSVESTANALLTTVTATAADIGGYSTMVFNRHNNAYFHSLQVRLQNEWRFIDSSGQLAQTEERFQRETVNFWVSMSFMFDLPANTSTVNIPIRCYTYSNAEAQSPLGDPTTAVLIATAIDDLLLPIITASVVDTNSVTTNLTEDPSLIVRYMSNACCEAQIRTFRGATITEARINDIPVTVSEDGIGLYTCTYTFNEVNARQFVFWAKDSRNKTSTVVMEPTIIPYAKPTVYMSYKIGNLNNGVWEDTPVGTKIQFSIYGSFFNGTFGPSTPNTLIGQIVVADIDYPYQIEPLSFTKNNDGSYTAETSYFDYYYQDSTIVYATIQDSINVVAATHTIPPRIPIFDFGKNDFNINGELRINGDNIFELIYPVGAVYLHSSSTIPDSISAIGSWSSITTGINNVYGWKRTA